MLKYSAQLILIIIAASIIFSCNEDEYTSDPNAKLTFTTDTISFDTVFTTIGSTTDWFKVKNENNAPVIISQIYLAGGETSPFRLNINGTESIIERDVEIEAGDSIFIFVEVTIDPTGQNNPMVINDSVVFMLNGNMQDVNLIAFGQDFHLFNGEVIQSQHWENDKPYLIYNSALVDSDKTLTIDAGCQIFFHRKSSLFVKGTLLVNGTYDQPVTFRGDRLEKYYENAPGQWGDWLEDDEGNILYYYGGIHFFAGSSNNIINCAEIKNAIRGIEVDSLGNSSNPVLKISNTRVENMTLNCLKAHTSKVEASNCIFANSGSYSVALLFGGEYELSHCTIANYYSYNKRNEPSLIVNNFYRIGNVITGFDMEKANFLNCIIYGNNQIELTLANAGNGIFNYQFNNCLIRIGGDSELIDEYFQQCIFDVNPFFTDISNYNYSLDSLSPARNIADIETAKKFPTDLLNVSRFLDEGPDLGSLEWTPSGEK